MVVYNPQGYPPVITNPQGFFFSGGYSTKGFGVKDPPQSQDE